MSACSPSTGSAGRVSDFSVWISNSDTGSIYFQLTEEIPKWQERPFAVESAQSMRTKLSDLEIRRALGTLPGWTRKGDLVQKTYSFARFGDGVRFVDQVAELADSMNHHPDIDIRYTKVTFSLSTHDAGGITQMDLDLAKAIEQAAGFDK